jgi:hypothetical protein
MKELNELFELAKEISSKQWFLNADEEVIAVDNDAGPDDSGEAFIGCAANIQLANYIAAASPENILAISEAFRALEQRAEAAEAECSRLNRESQNLSSQLGQCDRERRVALSKLAGLVKQKPVGTVSIAMDWNTHRNVATVNMRPDLVVSEMKDGDELFTRPAPAVSLAELVPDESALADKHIEWLSTLQRPMFSDEDWEELTLYTWLAFRDSARVQRAEILRNIEESK